MTIKKQSFSEKLISGKGHLIHKVTATTADNRPAFYFLLVEPAREKTFLKALEESDQSPINLEDYGNIIASCYGNDPSEEIRQLMKEKYGFDV